MLLQGVDHVAIVTEDLDRFCAFYDEVFGVEVLNEMVDDGLTLRLVRFGDHSEFNVFEIPGTPDGRGRPSMFGRGHIDHIGLRARDLDAFTEIRRRLMARGASDGFVTDFGPVLSVFFTDPDGMEGEVLTNNPDAQPGVFHPPGTPAPGWDLGR